MYIGGAHRGAGGKYGGWGASIGADLGRNPTQLPHDRGAIGADLGAIGARSGSIMELRYTDFDSCPIVIEVSLRDLDKLIELAVAADGPYRVLRRELIEVRSRALIDAGKLVEYETDKTPTPST